MIQKRMSSPTRLDELHRHARPALSVSFMDAERRVVATGERAEMNDEGYKMVLDLTSKYEMEHFVRRSVKDLGYKIVNEDDFRDYVAAIPTAAATKDFNSLKEDLQGQAVKPCSWVVD